MAVLALLSLVTLGVYPGIWYVRRGPFLGALLPDKKIGVLRWLPILGAAAIIVAGAATSSRDVRQLTQALAGVANLVAAFRASRCIVAGATVLRPPRMERHFKRPCVCGRFFARGESFS